MFNVQRSGAVLATNQNLQNSEVFILSYISQVYIESEWNAAIDDLIGFLCSSYLAGHPNCPWTNEHINLLCKSLLGILIVPEHWTIKCDILEWNTNWHISMVFPYWPWHQWSLWYMLLVWKFGSMLRQLRVRCKIFEVCECEREVMMEQLKFSFSIFRVFRNIWVFISFHCR